MQDKQIEPFPIVRFLSRRELLLLLCGTAAASLIGGTSVFSNSKEPDKFAGCLVSLEQTAGPYFVDEKLDRSDIRSDPTDNSIRAGVPLSLTLNLFQVSNKKCEPVSGAIVDVWHCDASGIYSDVKDFNADTRGQKFLRGFQTSGKKGKVGFQTIYPGWYDGRTVHIHFKIRTRSHEFTSQLYFDDSITEKVHKLKPYSERGIPTITNESDGVFRYGGDLLKLELAKEEIGYKGIYNVGFQID